MAVVIDSTTRIPPKALKDAGVVGVVRYLSMPSADWKVITPGEYAELRAAGIMVFLNWEYDARDWGTPNGATHGRLAAIQAKQLGYPAGGIILGSCDFDITAGAWNATAKIYALQFAAAVRAAGYVPGVYGPWDVLEWVRSANLMTEFWQAGMSRAWSQGRNANPYPYARLRQIRQTTIAGVGVDVNEIRQPLWKWLPQNATPKGLDMLRLQLKGDKKVWLTGPTPTWISPATDTALAAAGVPFCVAPDQESFDQIKNSQMVTDVTGLLEAVSQTLTEWFDGHPVTTGQFTKEDFDAALERATQAFTQN